MGKSFALRVQPDWANTKSIAVDITIAVTAGTRLFFPVSQLTHQDSKTYVSQWILEKKIQELEAAGRSRADIDPGLLEVFDFTDVVGNDDVAPVLERINASAIRDFFDKASEHLKFPKVRFDLSTTQIVLKRSGPNSKTPGTVYVDNGGEWGSDGRVYFGAIHRDGLFVPARDCPDAVSATIALLAADPSNFAGAYGRETGNCCFCRLELSDKRSLAVGYGPVCADHYGLAWGAAA